MSAEHRDNLFAQSSSEREPPFEFNEAVARVFPDMLRRSIPGYTESLNAIGYLTRKHAQPKTQCFDLGCSLGAAALAMRHNIGVSDCQVVGVDNAPAMIDRCQQIVAEDQSEIPVELRLADVREAHLSAASVVVMNYTLQFVPEPDRQTLIDRIAKNLVRGGVLVLSEKIRDADPAVDAKLIELHHEFKRRHAYSDLEISRKRAALENVLVPDTLEVHRERLERAGFRHIGVWLKVYNFASLFAIR